MFPYYLSIGMTYEQYWFQDPWLKEAFREADKLNRQRKSQEMWLQGLYIHNAVGVVVGNVVKKKGTARLQYVSEPIRVIPLTAQEKEEKAEQERQKVIDFFNNLAKKSKKTNTEGSTE